VVGIVVGIVVGTAVGIAVKIKAGLLPLYLWLGPGSQGSSAGAPWERAAGAGVGRGGGVGAGFHKGLNAAA